MPAKCLSESANPPCVVMDFFCRDSRGHCTVEVFLAGRASWDTDGSVTWDTHQIDSITLYLPVEPAGLDAFLSQLGGLKAEIGAIAHLPMA